MVARAYLRATVKCGMSNTEATIDRGEGKHLSLYWERGGVENASWVNTKLNMVSSGAVQR